METPPPTRIKFAVLIGDSRDAALESWRAVLTECLPPNHDLVVIGRGNERALRIAASLYAFDLIILFPEALILDNPTEDRFDRTVAMVLHLRATRDAALVAVVETRVRGFTTRLEQAGVHGIVEPPFRPTRLPAAIASALSTHRNAQEHPELFDWKEKPVPWTPKQAYATKPDYTILIGLDQLAATIRLLVGLGLGAKKHLRFLYFRKSSELVALAESQPFDFAFMYLGNIKWDHRVEDGSFLGAAGVLAELHAKHARPIVVTQGYELQSEYSASGVNFISAPFSIEDFRRCLPELTFDAKDQPNAGHKIFAVAVVGRACGIEILFLSMPLQELLGPEYRVELHYYQEVNDWETTLQTPDLVVLYLNPVLRDSDGAEVAPHEALKNIRTKAQIPVLFLTNEVRYGLEYAENFSAAGAVGTFCFLPPFPTVAYVDTLRECVHRSLLVRAQQSQKP